jgi:hypothetical protein
MRGGSTARGALGAAGGAGVMLGLSAALGV